LEIQRGIEKRAKKQGLDFRDYNDLVKQ